jgi:hypothetical protein
MYSWIWRHLPGAVWVKAVWSLTIAALVVFFLFQFVFPWLEPHLPFSNGGTLTR